MVHDGQTVSMQWLLLAGYRHLQMPNLMLHCQLLASLQTVVLDWPLMNICWPLDTSVQSAFSSE